MGKIVGDNQDQHIHYGDAPDAPLEPVVLGDVGEGAEGVDLPPPLQPAPPPPPPYPPPPPPLPPGDGAGPPPLFPQPPLPPPPPPPTPPDTDTESDSDSDDEDVMGEAAALRAKVLKLEQKIEEGEGGRIAIRAFFGRDSESPVSWWDKFDNWLAVKGLKKVFHEVVADDAADG